MAVTPFDLPIHHIRKQHAARKLHGYNVMMMVVGGGDGGV